MQINTKPLKKPKNSRLTKEVIDSLIMAVGHRRKGIPFLFNILLVAIVHSSLLYSVRIRYFYLKTMYLARFTFITVVYRRRSLVTQNLFLLAF